MWLSPGARIWFAATPVDMRLGFDGLAAKVHGVLSAGTLFHSTNLPLVRWFLIWLPPPVGKRRLMFGMLVWLQSYIRYL